MFPNKETKGINKYVVESGEAKIVADYAKISIFSAFNLDIITFYETLRDAVIYNSMQSEDGIKRLDEAWVLEQTKPDKSMLKDVFGKKE